MSNPIHPNYIKASNLVFLCMGLSVLYLIVFGSPGSFGNIVFILILFGVIAVLLRAGYSWMKYVLGVLLVLGLLFEPFAISSLIERDDGMGILSNITQMIIQIIVVVKLWQIPNTPQPTMEPEPVENVEEEEDTLEG